MPRDTLWCSRSTASLRIPYHKGSPGMIEAILASGVYIGGGVLVLILIIVILVLLLR